MGVSRSFSKSEPLERDTYVKLPDGVEKGNAAWKLPKPLRGRSTSCIGWCKTILDVLAKEFGWGVTALDEAVCFWARQGFGYGYGE